MRIEDIKAFRRQSDATILAVLEQHRSTTEALAARVEQIESTVDKFINGITDSICVSGNDAGTNIWYVRRLKSEILPTDDPAASILAERDARTLRMAIEVADKARLSLADQYGQNIKDGCSQMGGNMDWARLEGAVQVVQALRAKADELAKAGATEKQS